MEYEQDEQKEQGTLMDRIKESPRTVSALVIILIVAAAIYAFSGNQNNEIGQVANNVATTPTAQEEATTPEETAAPKETGAEKSSEQAIENVATPQPVDQSQLRQQSSALPEGEKTAEGYKEMAQAGDGITHLARRATTRYLSENTADYAVTNEHRIYIEDYIKDQLGSRSLQLGESMTISIALMQEAVQAAGQLSASQLQNLSQYTSALE